jgi:TRAP-type C4-dicarboxylate transport system substrate-binding protein
MKRLLVFLGIIIFIWSISLNAVVIKIGSIAPERSPWGKSLNKLAAEWTRISKGKVELKVYAGGIVGSEEDMLRKMKMGVLGGAGFTNIGLTLLYPDVYVLNIPFLIQSDEELHYVLGKMQPVFETEIEKKEYKVVIWSTVGWVHFFTKDKVISPDDLRKHKISFIGEPEMEQAWKKSGFHIVQNELKDLMMALQTGMVNAFYLPPLLAGSGQYFPFAPNLLTLKIAPLFGGIVLTKKVWNQIPAELHEPLMKSAKEMTGNLYLETIKLEKEVIDTMKKNGLQVNDPTADAVKKWLEVSDKGNSELIGKAFSEDIYKQLLKYIDEYRNQKK